MELNATKRRVRYTKDSDKIIIKDDTSREDIADGKYEVKSKVIDHTLAAAATSTETGAIPAGSVLLGFSATVKEAVTTSGASDTFDIGDGTDTDRWGAAIAGAKDTTVDFTDATADPTGHFAAAGDIVFDGAGAETFTAGVIRISLVFAQVTAPSLVPNDLT